jgi:hypothetical protein
MSSWNIGLIILVVMVAAWCFFRRLRTGQTSSLGRQIKNAVARSSGQRLLWYRSRDGLAEYAFSLAPQSNGFRIYIKHQPSYGSRDTGAHTTHRLHDQGQPYICWAGCIRSEEEALAVAARWADATQEYIKTGTTF